MKLFDFNIIIVIWFFLKKIKKNYPILYKITIIKFNFFRFKMLNIIKKN